MTLMKTVPNYLGKTEMSRSREYRHSGQERVLTLCLPQWKDDNAYIQNLRSKNESYTGEYPTTASRQKNSSLGR